MEALKQGRLDAVGQAQLGTTPSHYTVRHSPSRSTRQQGWQRRVLQHQGLQKHPTPAKRNSAQFTVHPQEGHCPYHPWPWLTPSGSDPHNSAPASARSASAVDAPVPSFPLYLDGSQRLQARALVPLSQPSPEASRATQHRRVNSHLQSIYRALCS